MITIHEHAPNIPTHQQRLLTTYIVKDVHQTIRRLEAKGFTEVWVWQKDGKDVIAHFAKEHDFSPIGD